MNTRPLSALVPLLIVLTTGTVEIGETLTCSTGTWANAPTSYTYQWTRFGIPIAGATASTYLLVTEDGDSHWGMGGLERFLRGEELVPRVV